MTVQPFQLTVPFEQSEKTKLGTVAADAAPPPTEVSGGEKASGTETNLRSFSPADVKDMAVNFGGGGGGSGKSIQNTYTNSSGSTIAALTPVRSSSGTIDVVDTSNESQVLKIAGVTNFSINNSASGVVTLEGLIENISTSISVDSIVYLSKTGTISSQVPDIGVFSYVAGDFVVKIGQILRNADNPANKDLKVQVEIMGQL